MSREVHVTLNAQIFALPLITCPKLFDFMLVSEEEDGSFSGVLVDIWAICDISEVWQKVLKAGMVL